MSFDSEESTKVTQSVTLRNRIISDKESGETLRYMVKVSRKLLLSNHNFAAYSKMLVDVAESINRGFDDYFRYALDLVNNHEKKRTRLINELITELLRFLALKVLLADNHVEIDYKEKRDLDGHIMYRFNPSMNVRKSWKALLLFPVTYNDVCKALGCSTPLDYDGDDFRFSGEASKSQWGRECYKWTVQTYQHLYRESAPNKYWPWLDVVLNADVNPIKTPLRTVKREAHNFMEAMKSDFEYSDLESEDGSEILILE
mmetsp:Transcript_28236/g.34880  ORF Transcript_28236/g.34880 Transcript_28236/m.34880 type:complete len:258 (-) Transcript_28236:61-834(-)